MLSLTKLVVLFLGLQKSPLGEVCLCGLKSSKSQRKKDWDMACFYFNHFDYSINFEKANSGPDKFVWFFMEVRTSQWLLKILWRASRCLCQSSSSASTSFWQETWCCVLYCGYGRCLSRQVPAPTTGEESVNQSCFGVSRFVAYFALYNGSSVVSWWDPWEFLGISSFLLFWYKGGSCTTCQCLYWQTVLVCRFLWYKGWKHHVYMEDFFWRILWN